MKKIYAIPSINSVLVHDGTSHIIFVNGCAHAMDYLINYNKFAFSNKFLMNFDHQKPVDNMLLIKAPSQNQWQQRGRILHRKFQENLCNLIWTTDTGSREIMVKTILIPRLDGYFVAHRICNKPPIMFESGGFPLHSSTEETKKVLKKDTVILSRDGLITGMQCLIGDAKPAIHKSKGLNPAGFHSAVPYFSGESANPIATIAFCVWANTKKRQMDVPSVDLQHNHVLKVKWKDAQHRIILDEGKIA